MAKLSITRRARGAWPSAVAAFLGIIGLAAIPQLLLAPAMNMFLEPSRLSSNTSSYISTTLDTVLSALPSSTASSSTHPVPKRNWAYVYFIVGCHPDSPNHYIGMLYNVVIGARILHQFGSNVDIVLLLQMHVGTSAETLPPDQANMLSAAGVKVRYLEKPTRRPTFHESVLRKFDVLKMAEYSRVLFMDADAIPLCSLDYLFELSEPDDETVAEANYTGPVLRRNVVLASISDPSTASFFILQPSLQYYNEIQDIIRRQEEEAFFIEGDLKFNRTKGWGHVFQGGDDVWTTLGGEERRKGKNNTIWHWYGDMSDQGLLYFWTKYHQRDVSIIIGDKIEHWVDRNGTAVLHHRDVGTLSNYPCNQPAIATFERGYARSSANPYRQYRHFGGKVKPWLQKSKDRTPGKAHTELSGLLPSTKFWWEMLMAASNDLNFTIMYNLLDGTGAPYGAWVNEKQLKQAVMARAEAANLTVPRAA